METVSIIVPVYNIAECLRQSLGCILSQTYKDLEIILVDDKSDDGTGVICDEIAESDSRVKVIHRPENGGAASARNTGLDAASGKYIVFFDGDDICKPDMIGSAVRYAEEYDADLVMWGMSGVSKNKDGGETILSVPDYRFQVTESAEESRRLWCRLRFGETKVYAGHGSNKLYKREIIKDNNVRFPLQRRLQDASFMLLYFEYVTRFVVYPDIKYKYYVERNKYTYRKKIKPDFFKNLCEHEKLFYDKVRHWGLMCDGYKSKLDNEFFGYLHMAFDVYASDRFGKTRKEKIALIDSCLHDLYFLQRIENENMTDSEHRAAIEVMKKGSGRKMYGFIKREDRIFRIKKTLRPMLTGLGIKR